MTIAVTGATGQLGRLAIADLKAKVPASDIVALARDPAKAGDLGVAVRAADYTDPATLEAALKGVDTLVLISSNEIGQRAVQHQNVINAAKATGVGRIIYTSLLRADTSPLSLAGEHVETEAALKASGIPHTILRNGWYTENYTGSVPAGVAHGAIVGSVGKGRVASATRADYAEAAAVVATSTGHDGKVYELAGDNAWTMADLAAEVSAQTGKDIPYNDLPEADYAAVLTGVGLPEGVAAAVASWDVGASQGALDGDSGDLRQLIGRPSTPLKEAVAAALKA